MGEIQDGTDVSTSITCDVTEAISVTDNTSTQVGGVRISRLVNRANGIAADSSIRTFSYDLEDNQATRSSGVLVSLPRYLSNYQNNLAFSTGNLSWTRATESYRVISSAPRGGAGSTQGSHLGYRRVVVADQISGVNQGRVVYSYTSALEFPDAETTSPGDPATSNDFRRGLLISQQTYRADGTLLARKRNTYYADSRTENDLIGVTITPIASPLPQFENDITEMAVHVYHVRDKWLYLKSSIDARFAAGDTTQRQVQQTTYGYANPAHGLISREVVTQPDGGRQIVHRRYAADYVAAGTDEASQGLRALGQVHALAPVVEDTEWRRRPQQTDSILTRSVVTTYRPSQLAGGEATQTLQFETVAPVKTYQTPDAASSWRLDARYKLFEQYSYQAGRLSTVARAGLPLQSYVWNKAGSMLLAVVKSSPSQAVAYTSFEEGEMGRWQAGGSGGQFVPAAGYTGQASYQLTTQSQLRCSGLPAGTYQLSCWLKAGAGVPQVNGQTLTSAGVTARGWQFYQRTLDINSAGTVTLTGTGQVDELRLCPVGAQMTTMTYRPLVGVTSQTDPSGRTTTYEYDALGRLLRVRDEQGRILTQQEYKYAAQP